MAIVAHVVQLDRPLPQDNHAIKEWRREGVSEEDQWIAAPGVRWLKVGKAYDGYWGHDDAIVHLVDVCDVVDVPSGKHAHLYPWYIGYQCKAMFLFDWSSGHGAFKIGALNAPRIPRDAPPVKWESRAPLHTTMPQHHSNKRMDWRSTPQGRQRGGSKQVQIP